MDQTRFPPNQQRPAGAGGALAAGFLIQAIMLGLLLGHQRIDADAAIIAGLVYGLAATVIWQHLGRLGIARFGWANTVTALRGGMIAVLPSLILAPDRFDPAVAWGVSVFGLLALTMDGLDGRLARRLNESSAFGARFDMEVDAAFVLFLSGLVAATGRAGPWILLAGAMRYLWVGATVIWPLLRRPLPPSRFRKSVCVILLLLLLLALAPGMPPDRAALPCVAGLVLLLASFGRDLLWLMCKARGTNDGQVKAARYDGATPVESE